ncbi:MAG TPA: hypothetical protein VFH73_07535 [Polyangia bacterium]|nr:hypothetical protein [Polyangia bacterium]
MTAALLTVLMMASPPPVAKVPPAVAREMAEVIVAVDKALGLESWESHGAKPCVDRGGEGSQIKDIGAEEARRCAAAAVEKGFPGLGKSYLLAILMASIGPVTVVALGTGEAAGWAAYSCDPGRKCPPLKITPTSKWGKRLVDRQAKACAQATTIWLPPEQRVCEGAASLPATPAAPTSP